VRSTLNPGTITVTAARDGLQSGSVTIEAKPVPFQDGLTQWVPPVSAGSVN